MFKKPKKEIKTFSLINYECLIPQRNGINGYTAATGNGCDAVSGHGANSIEGLHGRVVEIHSHLFNSGWSQLRLL